MDNEPHIGSLDSNGENEPGDRAGSHLMIMHIMNELSALDRDDKVILDFHLIAHFTDDPEMEDTDTEVQEYECVGNTADGSPIIVDTTKLGKVRSIIESYRSMPYQSLVDILEAKCKETEWMNDRDLEPTAAECLKFIRKMYGDYLIGNLIKYPHEFLDNVTPDFTELNMLFRCFNIPYTVKSTSLVGEGLHFLIRKHNWEEDPI